ncbi:Protein regulator of cytokinesis 1 [Acropora cervicornis]|uniref:Protein regulator of cytokinesis 1 n=1 Tax=Acropora cervicornis TaxID=6130 RepID=A0AAD9VF96_ACRCE|nr:Protein regulator of cytokinesis 1 [Acropora cervicornis]
MENESSSKNQSRHLSTSAVEESMQMIKNEVYQCIQNSMETLHSIWTEIGLQEDQKKDRTETVLYHLQHLFQEMVKEEKELKSTLLANVETCTKELEILSQELQVPVYKPETQMTILMLENDLRTKVDALKLEKHDRLKNLKSLRERESEFCDRMCLSAHNLGDVNVPTMEQLKELEANAKRQNSLRELKHEITRLWEDLEMEPSTMTGQEMAKADAETTFKLSSENLAKLKDLHQELENQEKRNAQEALELRESIKSLYDKLEVDQPEREEFFSKSTGYKPSVICKLRTEMDRLQVLKLQHMQKFIDGLRKELSELWDKCFFGPSQREEFAPAFDNNHTEELLAIHEHQVEVMKNYYEENKAIFKLMKKNDTNRLANRGGALLKEEKIRKGISKELPKIEQKLKTEVGKWEEEHERTFLINGCHYMDIITNQWAAFNAQKEHEKLERHKRQQEIMEKEMVFGSKPASTPKKSVCPSPRPTPASASGKSAGRPPAFTKPSIRKVANVVKKKAERRLSGRLAGKRRVLGEKNGNTSKQDLISNASIQVVHSSKSSTTRDETLVACTSYNEFANGLATDENHLRSSILNKTHSVMSFV